MKTLEEVINNADTRLMLGTVQFGMPYGVANTAGQPSYEQARDIIRRAYDSGIDSFDTAAAYGRSEEVIGKALAELNLTDKVMVVTKIPAIPEEMASADVKKWVETHLSASRQKLGTDVLPLVLLHRESDYYPAREFLAQAVNAGTVRKTGVSAGCYPDLMSRIVRADSLDAMQIPVNMFDRRFTTKTGILRTAAEKGVAVFTRSAYLQGLAVMPIQDIREKGQYFEQFVRVRQELDALADQAGLTLCEMAMRYVLSLTGITRLVVGLETVAQLEQNVRIAQKGPLDNEMVGKIDSVIPDIPDSLVDPVRWPKH